MTEKLLKFLQRSISRVNEVPTAIIAITEERKLHRQMQEEGTTIEQCLLAENRKLRRLLELIELMENEDPGCIHCAKRQDSEAVSIGKTGWDTANESHHSWVMQNRINPLLEEFNKIHSEIFEG